jgi:hypothetical protein
MKNLLLLLFSLSLLSSCGSSIKEKDKIGGYFIPLLMTSTKTDTVFRVGGSKYEIEILQTYTTHCPPSRIYKDEKNNPYYKFYRDMDFDITIYENGNTKFYKIGLTKKDFENVLNPNLKDSAVMNPIYFKFDPVRHSFIFSSWIGIKGSAKGKEVALFVNKDFKANYLTSDK